MQYMVETKNLRKVYRTGDEKVVALDNIDLTIEQGQVCCILGTSGSGKSTLLNQLAGLEKPTRGTVKIKGELISKMSEKQLAVFRQKHIGFVFQSYNLIQGMTAVENVAMPLMFRRVSRKKREEAAREMLKQVGLGERMDHRPNSSAWALPAPLLPIPRWYLPMSPPATWIPKRPKRSWRCSCGLPGKRAPRSYW